MTSTPCSLSLIIPTYNRADYVRRCLLDVAALNMPDMEIIVSDDGSRDNTAEVVAATNPHAVYRWQANSGTPATARNAAFPQSRGRYVAFLDCDDQWLPQVPQRVVELLDRYPQVDAIFADAKVGNPDQGYHSWIEVAGQQAFFDLPHQSPEAGFRILDRKPFFRRMAVRNAIFLGSLIIRREAFEASGMFDPSLRGAADWELWLRMSHRFTFGFLNEPMSIYTRHNDNMSDDRDGMTDEFCRSLRNVMIKVDLDAEDHDLILDRFRHHLFYHGYLAYDRGDYPTARRRFWQALRAGNLTRKTLAYWGACWLPRPLVRTARSMKQTFFPGRPEPAKPNP